MSSAKKSRGPPNPGNEPTEELGYPALVQYTFVPNDTESSEILVSEGDIVQLVYKVGGWVFVRTYNGKVGYIPYSFCKELESSKEVGSTYNETGLKTDISVKSPEVISSENIQTFQVENAKSRRPVNLEDNRIKTKHHNTATKPEKRVHFADQPKSRNSCDICRNFLTSFNCVDNNSSSAGQKKVNLKPHKLLKLLQTISKEGRVSFGKTKTTHNAQSLFGQITDNRINRGVNSSEFPIKFGNFCNQCDVLKDIFKNTNRYSMSDLYSTIRNLHLHAVTDSDSDQDEISESTDGLESRNQIQNGGYSVSEKIPKRSISFKEPENKQKVEIVRNNSFSGMTDVERSEFVIGTVSPVDGVSKQLGTDQCFTAVACTRAAKITHLNSCVESSSKISEQQNQKINNYFPENQHFNTKPPILTNGYAEEVTDFRSAEYHPPLVHKWRPYEESLSPEALRQRPPGIIREQTFEFESMKSRQKEVNFNDPQKENLNLTNSEKKHNGLNMDTRSFTMDSRRKPIVSNGDFSLDDHNASVRQHGHIEPENSQQGAITKCFTTYGQLANYNNDTNTGKSLTLDRHFKPSSQFSSRENYDKVQTHHHDSAYHETDNPSPKPTESNGVIDRRKVVARKVNPLTSPRNFMVPNGPLIGRKNDKDIRKSLLEHTAMKKAIVTPKDPMSAQPMRAQPMRAQHDIANPSEAGSNTGKTVLVKKFNKQMWRPSLAGSEGSDQRPFSPFGGTLPPSKIVKKKVVEVFV